MSQGSSRAVAGRRYCSSFRLAHIYFWLMDRQWKRIGLHGRAKRMQPRRFVRKQTSSLILWWNTNSSWDDDHQQSGRWSKGPFSPRKRLLVLLKRTAWKMTAQGWENSFSNKAISNGQSTKSAKTHLPHGCIYSLQFESRNNARKEKSGPREWQARPSSNKQVWNITLAAVLAQSWLQQRERRTKSSRSAVPVARGASEGSSRRWWCGGGQTRTRNNTRRPQRSPTYRQEATAPLSKHSGKVLAAR